MTHDTAFPFLTVLVLLPAGGALVTAAMPTWLAPVRHEMVTRLLGLGTTLATFALAITIAVRYQAGNGGFRLVSDHEWAPQLGISWHLGIDGISLFLVLMASMLFPLVLLAGGAAANSRASVAWLLLLEAGCLGSFVALDLVVFFLFFELTLVPVYFLMTGWGHARRVYAAVKFFLYTFLGSAFLLVGIVALAFIHQRQTGHLTFDLVSLTATHLGTASQVILFLAFTAAFAVKAPVFPFHTWSPDAYAEAPTGTSVVLAGVMAKMGTYGIIRFDLTLFPHAVVDLAPLLLSLGVAGILYGGVVACATRDLKRLVAYSSLAHLGFVVLGTFALTTQGLTGGVVQMVNHGLIIAVLFIVIGWIYERRGTWNVSGLRGLQRPAPILAGLFTVAMMAAVGLPGLNGFVGEFLVLVGTFTTHRWWAVAATFGVVLAALYLLWAYQQAFHQEPDPDTAKISDLSWRQAAVVAPLVAVIAFLGIYPKPVLDRITPSVDRLVQQVDRSGGATEPSVSQGPHYAAHTTSTTSPTSPPVTGGTAPASASVSQGGRR